MLEEFEDTKGVIRICNSKNLDCWTSLFNLSFHNSIIICCTDSLVNGTEFQENTTDLPQVLSNILCHGRGSLFSSNWHRLDSLQMQIKLPFNQGHAGPLRIMLYNTHNVVSSTSYLSGIRIHNVSSDIHWLHR